LIKYYTRKVYGIAEVKIYTFLTSPEMKARCKLHTLTASSRGKEPSRSCPPNTRLEVYQIFFLEVMRPNAGKGPFILEVSRSHSDTPQSVGLLWMSEQLVA
jgi:hypothetical protein